MRQLQANPFRVLLVALLTMLIRLLACWPVTAAPVRERIYVAAADLWHDPVRYQIYVYDALNFSIIDTIPFVRAFPTDIVISPSGHRLYVTAQGNGYVYALYAVDPISNAILWVFPDTTFDEYPFSFLYENGSRIMMGRNVIDAETGVLITRLPEDILPCEGPPGDDKIAVVGPFQNPNGVDTLRILDISSGSLTGGVLPRLSNGTPLATYWATLHPDMSRALVVGFATGPWFALIDLATGMSHLDIPLVYPQGRMRLSLSGDVAVVTDPSREGYWDSEGTVDIVDLDSAAVIQRFHLGMDPKYFLGQSAFIGNGGKTVLAGKPSELGVGRFTILDLTTLEFDTTVLLPSADTAAVAIGGVGVGDSCECCCYCRLDPACDGVVADVLDVVITIGAVIRGVSSPHDPNPSCSLSSVDVDCSGTVDVLDVTAVIDIAFHNVLPPMTFCDPCVSR